MVQNQIREQFMLDDNILELIENTPRDFFVPDAYKSFAYAETNIPIGHNQVMMKPNEEGRMLQALTTTSKDVILEIGTGSGYVTSLLAKLGKQVFTLDIFEDFSKNAKDKLTKLNINNVEYITKNAAKDIANHGPYDVICVTASVPLVPNVYLHQLKTKGRLFVIIGEEPAMTATLIVKEKKSKLEQQQLFEIALPAMIDAPRPESFEF